MYGVYALHRQCPRPVHLEATEPELNRGVDVGCEMVLYTTDTRGDLLVCMACGHFKF